MSVNKASTRCIVSWNKLTGDFVRSNDFVGIIAGDGFHMLDRCIQLVDPALRRLDGVVQCAIGNEAPVYLYQIMGKSPKETDSFCLVALQANTAPIMIFAR